GDVGGDLSAVAQLDASDLAKRRVRLLRGRGVHTGAHATLLGVGLQGRRLGLDDLRAAALTDQLLNCGHLTNSLVLVLRCNSSVRALLRRCGETARPTCCTQGTWYRWLGMLWGSRPAYSGPI